MSLRIEDYGMIGDCHTAALVSREGSIDWLCLPSFDSAACFAALLGTSEHGYWLITPDCPIKRIQRRYREDTLILETTFETEAGTVTLVDCMAPATDTADLLRQVVGQSGKVPMKMALAIRFDYGSIVPWVRKTKDGIIAIAGPDPLRLRTPVELCGENFHTTSNFTVSAGQKVPFEICWYASYRDEPQFLDFEKTIADTEKWWREWTGRCTFAGPSKLAVTRSLITLKALTYAPTGAIVAAPTTSLPELIGGVRNWDYRYCWLRDATLALYALMAAGYRNEARAWREWLLRSAAGHPSELQIMYGIAGERRLTELELDWLPGYGKSFPVRVGNAAYQQLQIDVFGELMDPLFACHRFGLEANDDAWNLQTELLNFLEQIWDKPDHGLWESRGGPQHFTFSKIMAWVAFDRGVKSIDQCGY